MTFCNCLLQLYLWLVEGPRELSLGKRSNNTNGFCARCITKMALIETSALWTFSIFAFTALQKARHHRFVGGATRCSLKSTAFSSVPIRIFSFLRSVPSLWLSRISWERFRFYLGALIIYWIPSSLHTGDRRSNFTSGRSPLREQNLREFEEWVYVEIKTNRPEAKFHFR
jgi:hypothetical protein